MGSPIQATQVTSTHVYPPDSGGRHRSHGIVKGFPSRGCRVDRFCQGGPLENYRGGKFTETVTIEEGYREIRSLNPLYDLASLPVLWGYPYSFLGRSLELWTPKVLTDLLDGADFVLVEEPWQVCAVSGCLEDIPLIYSAHNVEADRYEYLSGRWLYDYAFPPVERTERGAIEAADLLVSVSAADCSRFKDLYDPECPIIVAPNATAAENLRPGVSSGKARRVRERFGIEESATLCVFVGTPHPPNLDAVEAIVELVPELDEDVRVMIVGEVGEELNTTPQDVTVTGFVEDLDTVYAAADVALNPMRQGAGSNVKLLDYLAHELPTVSTSFGTRGFDVADGEHLLIRELSDFPSAISRLGRNPELAEQIGSRGADLVESKYTWDRVSENLLSELRSKFDF